MAGLNPFQTYSQQENTITNNTLLLFSELYELNPNLLEEFINGLIGETNLYEITPQFVQQMGNKGGGIMDGSVQLKSSRIIIETKRDGLEWIDKLLKYSNSFEKNQTSILFHLSQKKYGDKQINEIKTRLRNKEEIGKAIFYSLTYEDIVTQLLELCKVYPYNITLEKLSTN